MRPDIKKVICERERRGDRSYTGGKKHHEADYEYRKNTEERDDLYAHLDCLPSKEGMMHRLGWETRNFSENLGAVRGMVIANMGKNWDKVFSELCKLCPPNGTNIERHVHQHIDQFILRDTKWLNGEVHIEVLNPRHSTSSEAWTPLKAYLKQKTHYRYSRWPGDGTYLYFVHPKTRCISKMRLPKPAPVPKTEVTFFRTDKAMYGKFDSVWYELNYEPAVYESRKVLNSLGLNVVEMHLVQKDIAVQLFKDSIVMRYPYMSYRRGALAAYRVTQSEREQLYGKDVVVTSKRQISSKELHRLKLKNG